MTTIMLEETTLSRQQAHKADAKMYCTAFYPEVGDGLSREGGNGFASGDEGFMFGGGGPLSGNPG
jgi:hypothetical protein